MNTKEDGGGKVMNAIRKKDGFFIGLSECVYDRDGNEYTWDEIDLVLGDVFDFQIEKNESATLSDGVFIVGSGYLGFCVISVSTNGGIVEIGGKPLSDLTVTVSGKTITYGNGVGSSRVVKKLLKIA